MSPLPHSHVGESLPFRELLYVRKALWNTSSDPQQLVVKTLMLLSIFCPFVYTTHSGEWMPTVASVPV